MIHLITESIKTYKIKAEQLKADKFMSALFDKYEKERKYETTISTIT